VKDDDNAHKAMNPDYSLTEVQVFQLATLHSIYSSSSLSVLHGDISRKFRQDLPSWVPDWEASDYSVDSLRLEWTNLYDSCSQYDINKSTVPSKDGILFVDCKILDEIEFVGGVMLSEELEAVSKTIKDWHNFVEQPELSRRGLKAQHEQLKKAFWRALCADVILDVGRAERARPEDQCLFADWMLLSTLSPYTWDAEWHCDEMHRWENLLLRFTRQHAHWSDVCLSEHASILRFLSLLSEAVQTKNNVIVGMEFKKVSAILHKYIPKFEDVLFSDNPEFPRLSREDTVLYATSSYDDLFEKEREHYMVTRGLERTPPWLLESMVISGAQKSHLNDMVRRKRGHAWNQMSWRSLLNYVITQSKQGPIDFSRTDLLHQVSLMDQSIISATKSRRMFITKGRSIGLGSASTQVGDVLCLLKGGKTPFILRNSISEVPQTRFELIGDCYADGLMDAETLNKRILEMHKARIRPFLDGIEEEQTMDDIPKWVWDEASKTHPFPTWNKIGLV
jgi:hypothetical protein